MANKLLTLCIIHQHPKVLLGMKKRGFGEGRWNGFGGKVGEGETIEEAARREIREEAGIEADDLEQVGLIHFEFMGDPQILEVHLFRATSFSGSPVETEEMRPKWFMIDEIPFREMWPDDVYWFPMFLSGRKFKAKFLFEGHDVIVSRDIEEVSEI
ncbi:MAG: 8-oxo-dGTP diphosphatase [bacterium]|nr:8-oxo-dGTP diphosphatase [bacterium]MDZ4286175.1 8-oxo-dGTP diphosphatase [Candidatus Sungbacteria bacterium]